MKGGLQQDRLAVVSTLASTLADQILVERRMGGTLPRETMRALRSASQLLEERAHPVPEIVCDALAALPRDIPDAVMPDAAMPGPVTPESGEDAAAPSRSDLRRAGGAARRSVLSRLFQSMRPAVSA